VEDGESWSATAALLQASIDIMNTAWSVPGPPLKKKE